MVLKGDVVASCAYTSGAYPLMSKIETNTIKPFCRQSLAWHFMNLLRNERAFFEAKISICVSVYSGQLGLRPLAVFFQLFFLEKKFVGLVLNECITSLTIVKMKFDK
jgi:hypothetical protein